MTPKHDPFEDLQRQSADQLAAAIAVYGFRDSLGHPLQGCSEYQELLRRAAPTTPTQEITNV